MKLCQSCQQRPAVVEFIQVMGDVRREVSLCRECAMSHGMAAQFTAFQQLSQQILEQMNQAEEFQPESPEANVAPCANCGLSFEEFVRTGLLGCPQCYTNFGDVLTKVLRRLHGVTHMESATPVEGHKNHVKSEHAAPPHEEEVKRSREELEIKIQVALLEENYELAAQLRDQLKNL
jgi:protein arginine kinase activator